MTLCSELVDPEEEAGALMQYLAPADLEVALTACADGEWTILAGGTDFYPARVGRPLNERVIDISGLDELRGITVNEDSYRIGALTRWTDLKEADLPPV
ncbi:MAG TPA: FAD binding domain-containing protein, partial [Acidimicrobiia bacterium]|nr:FAD binding domain-containing protein [Acidimicrobiia bacterium]